MTARSGWQSLAIQLPNSIFATRVAARPGGCLRSPADAASGEDTVLSVGAIVLGVTDVPRAVRFWQAALGYRLHPNGFGGAAPVLVPAGGSGTPIALQRNETPPQEHPRIHLDLHVADAAALDAEAARLVALGAARVDWDSYPADPDFVVLADPDGNRFCIVDLGHQPV
jgi:catechol 2,3-dioxygenase-like lactoylglutathione lyase family enzyme